MSPHSSGPSARDLNTVAYSYRSSTDAGTHPYAGLNGALVIGSAGAFGGTLDTSADPVPVGVDQLIVLQFLVTDESVSPFITLNQQRAAIDPQAATLDANFFESCKKSNINGYLYCNQPQLNTTLGATTRFVMIGAGTEADIHAPGFIANNQVANTTVAHTFELMPSVSKTFDVTATTVGQWHLWCEIQDHYNEGMRTFLNVNSA